VRLFLGRLVPVVLLSVLAACDSAGPSPLEGGDLRASIDFELKNTNSICQEYAFVAQVFDVNGLAKVDLFLNDVPLTSRHFNAAISPVEIAYDTTFALPGPKDWKVVATDEQGNVAVDSNRVTLLPDEAFEYWPLDVGQEYSFDYRAYQSGFTDSLVGRLIWTIGAKEQIADGIAYEVEENFSGYRSEYDNSAREWGDRVPHEYSFTFMIEESEGFVTISGRPTYARFRIPKFDCSGQQQSSGSAGHSYFSSYTDWMLERGNGPVRMTYDYSSKQYWRTDVFTRVFDASKVLTR
jgi:hypothetical protein